MLPQKQQETFGAFYDSVRNNGIFDSKTTVLLSLAAAMAHGCVPCTEYYLGQGDKEGITEEEIGAVQAVVMAVGAGKINAQLREAQRHRKSSS